MTVDKKVYALAEVFMADEPGPFYYPGSFGEMSREMATHFLAESIQQEIESTILGLCAMPQESTEPAPF